MAHPVLYVKEVDIASLEPKEAAEAEYNRSKAKRHLIGTCVALLLVSSQGRSAVVLGHSYDE